MSSIASALLLLAAVTIAAQVSGHAFAPVAVALGACLAGLHLGMLLTRVLAQRIAERRANFEGLVRAGQRVGTQASASGATSL